VREKPEKQGNGEAENEASYDGEIEGGVFAAVDDVTGKFSETEGELSAEVENGTDDGEQGTEEKQDAAELAEGIHRSIIEERPPGRRADGRL
jgi:hypothetical protein